MGQLAKLKEPLLLITGPGARDYCLILVDSHWSLVFAAHNWSIVLTADDWSLVPVANNEFGTYI